MHPALAAGSFCNADHASACRGRACKAVIRAPLLALCTSRYGLLRPTESGGLPLLNSSSKSLCVQAPSVSHTHPGSQLPQGASASHSQQPAPSAAQVLIWQTQPAGCERVLSWLALQGTQPSQQQLAAHAATAPAAGANLWLQHSWQARKEHAGLWLLEGSQVRTIEGKTNASLAWSKVQLVRQGWWSGLGVQPQPQELVPEGQQVWVLSKLLHDEDPPDD